MINFEEIIKEIEQEEIEETTTKELKDKGLNDYYIKKACENGNLEKISRGKYKILAIEKRKNKNRSFKAFIKAVFNNDFVKAYDNLLIYLENQLNNNYGYNIKLYFLLLKELLPSDKDFSFIDEIPEYCDNENYFQYLTELTKAVLSSDFNKAKYIIYNYKKEEEANNESCSISTKIFLHLVINIKKQKSASVKNKIEEENEKLSKEEITSQYKNYFINAQKTIENNNYEEALDYLKKALYYAEPKHRHNLKLMINILEKYLELKNSKVTLEEIEIDYSEYQDNYSRIFNVALNNQDYQTAYKNIGKCLYYNKNSMTLKLYRKLLSDLINQNKLNKQNNQSKNSFKEQSNITIESAKEESKKDIDINVLLDLIYDRKYDEVKNLLKGQEKSENHLYKDILYMIKYMEKTRKFNKIYENPIHFYTNDLNHYFKRFYEAIYYGCYEEAYTLVDKCIEVKERYNDSAKFVIYKYLLEDIINLKEEIEKSEAQIKKLQELTALQKAFISKHDLEKEDFENLENITLEKIELSRNFDTTYDNHIIEMLESIRNIENYKLDNNSFETLQNIYESTKDNNIENSKQNILDKFLEAIRLGAYQEAYQISNDDKWYQEMRKSENKDYLIIYKKLLAQINQKIEDNSKPVKPIINEKPLEEIPLINGLETLKTLIKNRKFNSAYNFYQENNLEGINEELDLMLQTLLPFLITNVYNESEEIRKSYKTAFKRGDFDLATQYLNEYEEFIKFNELERNLDYYKARVSSEKLEIDTPDFVEKEQLYDAAKYYFQKHQNEKSIEILNEYIAKDKDASAKGYLLRGRCHERLKQFDLAKMDYEKAISIIPEPYIYHRLGRLYHFKRENKMALSNYLEYEKRKPGKNKYNLKVLSEVYQALGEKELSEKYKSLIKSNN